MLAFQIGLYHISPVKCLVSGFAKAHVEGCDAVVQRQPPLHRSAFSERENLIVRPVMAQQRWHVALYIHRHSAFRFSLLKFIVTSRVDCTEANIPAR